LQQQHLLYQHASEIDSISEILRYWHISWIIIFSLYRDEKVMENIPPIFLHRIPQTRSHILQNKIYPACTQIMLPGKKIGLLLHGISVMGEVPSSLMLRYLEIPPIN